MSVSSVSRASAEHGSGPTGKKHGPLFLPPTPTSPISAGEITGTRQRTMHLSRPSLDAKNTLVPWLPDKSQVPTTPLLSTTTGTQRLRLPKRRTMSSGRSGSSDTVMDVDAASTLARPATASIEGFRHGLDAVVGRSSECSVPETLMEETHPFPEEPVIHARGTRSMSAVHGHIALSAPKRGSLCHRLSHSTHHVSGLRVSTSPTLPISTRSRVNSSISIWRGAGERSQQGAGDEESRTEMMIRLSMDASQSRGYRMLLEGDSILSELCVLEDERQRAVSGVQAGFGRKLVGLYFAATWSADCDVFTPLLQAVSSANNDDLVIVHVSADHHPADLARMMVGSGWLCVPWCDKRLRQDLLERMEVSVSELPKLVIVDGSTHHVITTAGRADVERRPLTCVREWRKSRAGLTWWNQAKPW
ncbi:hypothetical protein H4218_000338 [Coemansia sp. IMI 209128]|nr:hypothetical protein GGI10_003091 [Coemansia sp. RSA 2530]KAJ2703256.1 hypothetical protein H4218_000338 [Coemansia sp. IMI 209128]